MRNVKKTIILATILLVSGLVLTGCMANKNDQVQSQLNEANYKKAIKTADKALEGEPADKKFLFYNRGRAKMHLERYDEAIDDFQQALKMNNDNEWAKWPTYRIGQVNVKRGNYEEAIENYSSALSFERNWLKAIEARAEAKSKMGDEVGAEEDRQLVRQIKERREKKQRRKAIRKERKELMKEWKNLTNDAPLENYGYQVRGVLTNGLEPHFDSTTSSCDLDTSRTTFEEVDQRMTELGGKLVEREDNGEAEERITWRFTWWFKSHPDIKFDYNLSYDFEDCSQREDGSDVLMILYDGATRIRGHYPAGYESHADWDKNREMFGAEKIPKWINE